MSDSVDLAKLFAWKPEDRLVSWTRRDAILYALGVGVTDQLCYLYEKDENFKALPTLVCATSFKGTSSEVIDFNANSGSFPGLTFNPAQILHGEEFIEILGGGLPTHGTFVQRSKVLDFLDKGKGGLLIMETTFHPQDKPNGPPVARLVRTTFIRGLGGHGRKKLLSDPRPVAPAQPTRAPDVVRVQKTEAHQALLYRLSGDYNPLHADPAIAQMVGFERPILHGLCSFGFSTQAVLAAFPGINVKSVQTRFSSPVLPGATLETRMWREGAEWILFETLADGKVSLSGGAIQVSAAKL